MRGHVARYALDHQRERAGRLNRQGVFQQFAGVALHLEAAESSHRLRGQTDVAHQRNVGRRYSRDRGALRTPPSSFTAWAPPSFISRPAFSSACCGLI